MQSQDPVYSQNDPLLVDNSIISKKRDHWKTIAKIATVFIGILFITSEVVGKNNENKHDSLANQTLGDNATEANSLPPLHRTYFKTQIKSILLRPKPGQNSVKFTYDIIKNTYSHDNDDGSQVRPYVASNIERVVDKENNETYLHPEYPLEIAHIHWVFNVEIPGKSVEKILVQVPGIEHNADDEGEIYAKFAVNKTSNNIPMNKTMALDRNIDTVTMNIIIHKPIKFLKTNSKESSGVTFSIKVYWKTGKYPTPPVSSNTTTSKKFSTSSRSNDTELRRSEELKEQYGYIQLQPESGQNYVKFTYDIINNIYSHDNEDGSPVNPKQVFNIKRVVDEENNEAYIGQEALYRRSNMYWQFDLRNTGKNVEKVVVKMTGMDEITQYAGSVECCLNYLINCTDIPINESLTIEQYVGKLYIEITLHRPIKVLKTDVKGRKSVESFSIEVYWKDEPSYPLTTTTAVTEMNTTPKTIATSPTSKDPKLHLQYDNTTTTFTQEDKLIELRPTSEANYVKFWYNIVRNTYSQTHTNGSPVKPYLVANIERTIDTRLGEVFLHKKERSEHWASIAWFFNIDVKGKLVEKIIIRMSGIEELILNSGTTQIGENLNLISKSTRIPIEQNLTIDNPQLQVFFIMLHWSTDENQQMDARAFKTDLEDGINSESFSVEVFWKSKQDHNQTTISI
ncbi:PAW domain-containing protein [Caenorhabditis elegans]|uniref:PAW domain-containing protein n=1 Tax=Caenorhabditis elegans TaxID=6239 RepID=A0A131MB53_CAEEL|nr:PAW domain-containing protein [Caenorhabditis elegans]CZR14579.1 PAW domain-containing protein [Caenorhabditis elegans]|eukprot:NP_001309654.1 Uncharacterized protein CELE_T20D4.3 [Caenorhabditis elegans]